MAERVVDDLETIEIEEQDGEFRAAGVVRCRALAQLIERRAEHAPVRQAGQWVFRRQPRHMGLRFGPFGDVREGLYEAAVGKVSAANLDHGSVRPLAFANG